MDTVISLCKKEILLPLSKLFGISTLERFLLEIVKHLDQGERYFSAQIWNSLEGFDSIFYFVLLERMADHPDFQAPKVWEPNAWKVSYYFKSIHHHNNFKLCTPHYVRTCTPRTHVFVNYYEDWRYIGRKYYVVTSRHNENQSAIPWRCPFRFY